METLRPTCSAHGQAFKHFRSIWPTLGSRGQEAQIASYPGGITQIR